MGYLEHIQDMKDVMQTRAEQGILDTDHGQEEAMDMVHRLLMIVIQVRIYHVITFTIGKSVITADIIGLIKNNNYYHVGENVLITQVCEHIADESFEGQLYIARLAQNGDQQMHISEVL